MSLATSFVPTASLLVTNLPTLLFSQAQDLHPLFLAFGHIEKLEIVQVSPLGTMSVVVQYSVADVAHEAKETLSGQLYGSYQIEARCVKTISSNLLDISSSGVLSVDRKTDDTGDFLGQSRATLDDYAGCCKPRNILQKHRPSDPSIFLTSQSILIFLKMRETLVVESNFEKYKIFAQIYIVNKN